MSIPLCRWCSVLAVCAVVVSACSSSGSRRTRTAAASGATSTTASQRHTGPVLTAADGARDDNFGGARWYDTSVQPPKPVYYATPGEAALSTDGNTAVIGAPGHTISASTGAGAAYVFGNSPDGWSQSAELSANDARSYDGFGWGVALSGDGHTAVVGAPYHDSPTRTDDEGAAYVFSASDGRWSQAAGLRPLTQNSGDNFGWSVALSRDGNWALVGSPGHSSTGAAAKGEGAAFLFHRRGVTWSQVQVLTSPTSQSGDNFGSAVALSADGSTALVTSFDRVDDAKKRHAGVMRVFTSRDGWQTVAQRNTFTDPNSNADATGDAYGASASLSDDGHVAAVAAPDVNVGIAGANGLAAGAAYVYTTSAGWADGSTTRATLLPPAASPYQYYGSSVAFAADGLTLLIGADNAGSDGQGAAYVARVSPSWPAGKVTQQLVAAPHPQQGRFGTAVASSASGAQMLATSPLLPIGANPGQGAAFAFLRPAATP